MENQTPYLPHELILEILLRLPVKSLIRFKCVCKLWLTLISNPNFANSHFQLAATTHTHTRRILSISYSSLPIQSKDFESSLDNDSASLNLSFMHPQSYFYLKIQDSCRGFIFLHCCSSLYIWNPSTGVHKEIPSSPFISNLNEYYFGFLYGFGYDESRDDYLVVSMCCDKHSSYLNFYSLRDNTWKEIEGTHLVYKDASCNNKVGLLFNGSIHWFAYRRDYLSVDLIVAFNLMERKLLEIPIPDDFDHDHRDCGLWVFGELLSLWAIDNNYNDTIEIWVIKEYKRHPSWTKTLVLLIDNAIPNFCPIYSTKNGDIIGTDGGFGLVKYNDKGKFLEYHSDNNYPRRSKTIMYTESLLSLPLDGEQV